MGVHGAIKIWDSVGNSGGYHFFKSQTIATLCQFNIAIENGDL